VIVTRSVVQGDLIDPATGERLVLRIPAWFRAAERASSATAPPVVAPLDVPPAPATRGVWTDGGYLPPGSF
jgi:hypothetical protein